LGWAGLAACLALPGWGQDAAPGTGAQDPDGFGGYDPFEDIVVIADPIEPWNRMWFRFNDGFYYRIFRPMAKTYNRSVPKTLRRGFSNMFQNFKSPVPLINSLLQGDVRKAGKVVGRFGLNTVFGFAGYFDLADAHWGLTRPEEDSAQTLGRYGFGPGFYIVWPFLGPSTFRETVGLAADTVMVPRVFIFQTDEWIAISAADYFNENSLHLGEYESFTRGAIEPYIALRDAYIQNRQKRIEE
jgi:phospholipid-binding lipoprotein MlaA